MLFPYIRLQRQQLNPRFLSRPAVPLAPPCLTGCRLALRRKGWPASTASSGTSSTWSMRCYHSSEAGDGGTRSSGEQGDCGDRHSVSLFADKKLIESEQVLCAEVLLTPSDRSKGRQRNRETVLLLGCSMLLPESMPAH